VGYFVWPSVSDGKIHLTPAQLSMLLEGLNRKHPLRTHQPGLRI
jgi:transposase